MVLGLGILEPRNYDGDVTGTVVMMARQGSEGDLAEQQAGHDGGLKRNKDGIVLHPQPRNDPNDPLNWPVWRRDLALGVIGFQSFIIGGMSPLLASAFTVLSEEFDVTQSTLAYLVGGYMLAMGVGSLFLAPTAVLYGKRLVYLIALVIFLAGTLWAGASHSFGMLLGARILMGLGGAPTESLPSASIAEIYFLHERAYRLGLYTLLMLGGKNLVPMVAAFVIGDLEWNWVFWILACIAGMNLVLTYLFVPETWWDRTPIPNKRSIRESALAKEVRANSLSHSSSAPDTLESKLSPERSPIDSEHTLARSVYDRSNTTEDFADFSTRFENPTTPQRLRTTFAESVEVIGSSSPAQPIAAHNSAYLRPLVLRSLSGASVTSAQIPRKSYAATLKIYNGRFSNDKWWMVALRPFVLYAYPSVLFSTFLYAFSVVWLITISETISSIFSAAPYHFSTTSVGLLYIATFIGGCLGSAVAGKLSDRLVRILSRWNGGIYEPEYRVVMVVPVLAAVAAGMMGFGWSSDERDLWIVPAIFLGLIGFGCSLGSTTAITYVVDSYKMFAAEALVTLNFTKNLIGFLFSLFVPKFLKQSGPRTTFIVFGSIHIAVCLCAIPIYIFGKRFRHWTDESDLMHYLYLDEPEEADLTQTDE